MKYFINNIQLTNNDMWEISGTTEGNIHSIQAYYTEVREYKHPEKKLQIPFEQHGDQFTARFHLDDIAMLSIPDRETLWRFKVNTDFPYINLVTDGPVTNEPFRPSNSLYQYQFTFPEGILTFHSIPLEVSASVTSFSLDDTSLSGTLQIQPAIPDNLFTGSLLLKRRPTASFYLFHEQKQMFQLGTVNNNKLTFSIPLSSLSAEFIVDDTNVLDAVIEISPLKLKQSIPAFLSITPDLKLSIPSEASIQSPLWASLRSYVTGSNRLSFYLKKARQGHATLTKFDEDNTSLRFHLRLNSNLTVPFLVAKRQDKKANMFESTVEQSWLLKKGLAKYTASINKKDFLSGPLNKANTVWDFYVRSNDMPDVPIEVSNEISLSDTEYFEIDNKKFKAKVKKNNSNKLSCYTIAAPQIGEKPIKVAVMGTCFSRNAFNSSPFFNPDYKLFFECSFTQFHSSIISVMTETYSAINLKKYDDMSPNEKTTVAEDVKKDFFTNLKNSNSDYFLIDLYPDAVRPVIWLDSKSAITLSYVIEQSQLLNDLSYERIIDHIDNEAFFNEWKNYADLFIEKLTEIIPADHIILNLGGFTTSYYDKNRVVTQYPNKMAIERNNYFWDRLNNYFLSQLPEARVIDFSKKPYIGDFYYPFGHSFSHFESTYYKDFLKELIYITSLK
ncbi:DUF6270 domain-containing protein [Paenilisteria weihenstephanensis]|uniref:Teichoic acid biosynthesis protein n=1 Tax=Listeria weihenstephanensis TaxID=1006155 RepID=A0A1S7FYQ6_9LIST|nr:DUF6270 domain-containing protein [Listeria weihenstephanensis]AQY52553.1 teichoic acid biosynthesis protein [Listeria weihenstephanensis]